MRTVRSRSIFFALLAPLAGIPATAVAQIAFAPVDAGHLTNDRKSCGGVTMLDFDGDGNVDILITAGYDVSKQPESQPSRLYWGDGNAHFTLDEHNALTEAIAFGSGSTWGDFDNDGILDCFVSCQLDAGGVLARGLGGRKFEILDNAAPHTDKGNTFSCAWSDIDRDGILDLLLCNNAFAGPDVPFLYRGNGKGGFVRVTGNDFVDRKASTGGAYFCDYDDDGLPDLFAPNNSGKPWLLHNDGNMKLLHVPLPALDTNPFHSSGCSWVDYEGDGRMDLSIACGTGGPALLFRNTGSAFERVSLGDSHLFSTNTELIHWADLNNDGHLDCVVPNWGAGSFVYSNNGDGSFRRIDVPGFTDRVFNISSCALADYDNDGRIDMVFGQWPLRTGTGELTWLFHNESRTAPGKSNWIKLDLHGTNSNKAAIGARVRLTADLGGKPSTQTREVDAGNGFRSQGDLRLHFGLAEAPKAAHIEIRWPSGKTQTLENLKANQVHVITEP